MKELRKVEFDSEVEEDETYREVSDFEKILNKRFFYGKAGYNVQVEHNLFITKEEGQEIVKTISNLEMRKAMGDDINILEKLALQVLLSSQGN